MAVHMDNGIEASEEDRLFHNFDIEDDKKSSLSLSQCTKKDIVIIVFSLMLSLLTGFFTASLLLNDNDTSPVRDSESENAQESLSDYTNDNKDYIDFNSENKDKTDFEGDINDNEANDIDESDTDSKSEAPSPSNKETVSSSVPTPSNNKFNAPTPSNKETTKDDDDEKEDISEKEEKINLNSRNMFSKYPGFSDLNAEYLKEYQTLIKNKHEYLKGQNLKLDEEDEPSVWDVQHAQNCLKVNKKFDGRINDLSKKYGLQDPNEIFISNWSELISTEETTEGLEYNLPKIKELLDRLRQDLVRYYEISSVQEFKNAFDRLNPHMATTSFWLGLEKVAKLFATKIVNKEKIIFSVLGSSVMSGMDNCWDLSYVPLYQRTFDRIFSAFNNENIGVEVRPGGQNGKLLSDFNNFR